MTQFRVTENFFFLYKRNTKLEGLKDHINIKKLIFLYIFLQLYILNVTKDILLVILRLFFDQKT